MPANERKYLLCSGVVVSYRDLYKHPRDHVIGELRQATCEGERVTILARWDVSIPAFQVPPSSPEIDEEIVGDVRQIKCRYAGFACGNRVSWYASKSVMIASFKKLMSHFVEEVKPVEIESVV